MARNKQTNNKGQNTMINFKIEETKNNMDLNTNTIELLFLNEKSILNELNGFSAQWTNNTLTSLDNVLSQIETEYVYSEALNGKTQSDENFMFSVIGY